MPLQESALVEDVRSRLFAASHSFSDRSIGAELEVIPLLAETHLPAPMPDTIAAIRKIPAGVGWSEEISDSGAPSWSLAGGGRVSFEPGGQIEISSKPFNGCSALIEDLRGAMLALSTAAAGQAIALNATGVDPYNDISAVPLRLHSDRYVWMTRYLEARGDSGVRMMRQTAALQISIEHGPSPKERWRLLNALAPYAIALFANSSRYAGRDTGHASYRAHLWRTLDSSRTGMPYDASDPALEYARFALSAGAIKLPEKRLNRGAEFQSFRSILPHPELRMEDWRFH